MPGCRKLYIEKRKEEANSSDSSFLNYYLLTSTFTGASRHRRNQCLFQLVLIVNNSLETKMAVAFMKSILHRYLINYSFTGKNSS